MYTIAILDEEQKERDKFINFFEKSFNVVELQRVKSIDDLIDRIKSDNIDAIAIDYKLKDHGSDFQENGDYFFNSLIEKIQNYPAFILTQDPEHTKKESKKINPLFIVDKAKLHETDSTIKESFINDITNLIANYKNDLKAKIERLKELEKIKGTDDFSKCENEYLTLNNELSKAIIGYSPIPLKFFSKATNEKLDEIISKTDELLNRISKAQDK